MYVMKKKIRIQKSPELFFYPQELLNSLDSYDKFFVFVT